MTDEMEERADPERPAAPSGSDGSHPHHPHAWEKPKRKVSAVLIAREAVRNSPWVFISVAVHAIVIAVLAITVMGVGRKPAQETVITQVAVNTEQEKEPEPPEPPPEIDRKAVPENVEAEVVTPDEEVFTDAPESEDLSLQRGDPTASQNPDAGLTGGTSIGVGGGGHRGSGRPGMAGRRAGKGNYGRGGGETQQTEAAVRDGLVWLLRHQNDDGAWTAMTLKSHCTADSKCCPPDENYTDRFDVGLTGLAVLAFLGANYNFDSRQVMVDTVNQKKISIGPRVKAGLQWLKQKQKPDGSFTPDETFMYNEAIATLALTEACALAQGASRRVYREAAQKGLDFLVSAQKTNPSDPNRKWGWRYITPAEIEAQRGNFPNEKTFNEELFNADISVTGWVVMALKSGVEAGLNVPQTTIAGALDFARAMAVLDEGEKKGLSGYLKRDQAGAKIIGEHDDYDYHRASMASVNMCVRIFLEHNPDDPYLVAAADNLIKDLPDVKNKGLSVDYYYWYYGSLALNQIDGPDSPTRTNRYWSAWTRAMQGAILDLQEKQSNKTCSSGGWLARDRWTYGVGPVYSTAINVLTLEVYYRYANAFGASGRNVDAGGKPPTNDTAPSVNAPPKSPEDGNRK